jgi:hypothetical protein
MLVRNELKFNYILTKSEFKINKKLCTSLLQVMNEHSND